MISDLEFGLPAEASAQAGISSAAGGLELLHLKNFDIKMQ